MTGETHINRSRRKHGKQAGDTCWRTKRVYALQQKSIGQVLATRDYNYSGTSCTPVDHLDTWYKYNDVGNVIATLDYNGNITSRIDMESFGTVHNGGYNTPRLTTKEYDADSGLYYFGARWYDKDSARFISPDPMSHSVPGGVPMAYNFRGLTVLNNSYVTSFQNPSNFYDYAGLLSIRGRKITGFKKFFGAVGGTCVMGGGLSQIIDVVKGDASLGGAACGCMGALTGTVAGAAASINFGPFGGGCVGGASSAAVEHMCKCGIPDSWGDAKHVGGLAVASCALGGIGSEILTFDSATGTAVGVAGGIVVNALDDISHSIGGDCCK